MANLYTEDSLSVYNKPVIAGLARRCWPQKRPSGSASAAWPLAEKVPTPTELILVLAVSRSGSEFSANSMLLEFRMSQIHG